MDYFTKEERQKKLSILLSLHSTTLLIVIMLIAFSSINAEAQNHNRYYKSQYRKQNSWYSNACHLLEKKRVHQSNRKVRNYTPQKDMELEPTAKMIARKTQSERIPTQNKPSEYRITPKVEKITPERIAELHKKEEEVLAENNLPQPTSQQQEKVRKKVGDKLASKTNVYPLTLDPLFFNFDQDEFSVVDMEPFLVAAEYAIQGRTVLIEGHTDSKGADNYNVNLSIKRVQKIRQLMLDMGVPDDRISVVGYGEELKTNSNTTEQGREKNRRVDFTIF